MPFFQGMGSWNTKVLSEKDAPLQFQQLTAPVILRASASTVSLMAG